MTGRRTVPGIPVAGILLAAIAVVTGCSKPATHARTLEHFSPVYSVDREYRSMQGPSSTQRVSFPEADSKELLWITGYRAVMVGADGESPISQEYMCHSNMDFDRLRHAKLFDLPVYHSGRLFTLSQGQFEIEFPSGFGLPYYADEKFSLVTQVLNLNPDGQSREVRHKVTIEYLADRDLDEPMKPLFMTSGWGLKLLSGETGHFGVSSPSEEEHGESCLAGEVAGRRDHYTDEFGREFTGHWVVEPGREVNTTLVTRLMDIPYDTTLHYVAVHLHPFAESLELVDLTDGKTIFRSKVENAKDQIGLDRVEYFSSVKGIPVFKDHEYQIVSVYSNTTDEPQDSMAVMLLYLHDKRFDKSTPRPIEAEVAHVGGLPSWRDERIVLHTSLGQVTIRLYNTAPNNAERLLRLARLGVLNTMNFSRVESYLVQTGDPGQRSDGPLSVEQEAEIRPIDAELTDVEFVRGTVAMVLKDDRNPHSAEASFFIVLERTPWLDNHYTVVGRVTEGLDVLHRMRRVERDGNRPVEPIAIERAEVLPADPDVQRAASATRPP